MLHKNIVLIGLFFMTLGMSAQIFHHNNQVEVFHNNSRHIFDETGHHKSSIPLSFSESSQQGSFSHYFKINYRIYAFSFKEKHMYELQGDQWYLLNDASDHLLDGKLAQWNDKILWVGRSMNSQGRNLILYFDQLENTWVPLANQILQRTASNLSRFTTFTHNDKLILFNCFMPSPNEPFKMVESRDIFEYDLQSSSWSRFHSFFEFPQRIQLITGVSNYTAFVEPDTDRLFILDQNEFTIRKFSIKMLFGIENPLEYGIDGNVLWTYFQDNALKTIDINELIENFKAEENMWYLHGNFKWMLMYVLFGVVSLYGLVMIIYYRRKSRQKLVLNGEVLWFGIKKRKLSKEQISFLTQMLTGATLDFYDVVSLFNKKNFSISHSHKLKNDLIRDVQEILDLLMGDSKALIVEKSPEDSRMSVYRLDLNLFDPSCVTSESKQSSSAAA